MSNPVLRKAVENEFKRMIESINLQRMNVLKIIFWT
jgi:hypothetical protein